MTQVGFLGAGNIAQAIMGGLIENGFAPSDISACDPSDACMQWVTGKGITAAANNHEVIASSDVVMLCVKPNVVLTVLQTVDQDVSDKLFVSVAAGITTGMMSAHLPTGTALVRCMPNTPALVQTGMTALYPTADVSDAQRTVAGEVLAAVGEVIWVNDEADLDAVTAVSGSGPAYFFLMMESMINAAEAQGLSADTSRKLVLQTALGAARMACQGSDDPAALRQNVTSPGGTTQAALEYFESKGFADIVDGAVAAARTRSIELAQP